MRNMVVPLVLSSLLLFALFPLLSQAPYALTALPLQDGGQAEITSGWATSVFCLSAGYRVDNLSWNIAGNSQGEDPNVLSELSWSGVTSFSLKLLNRTVIRDWVYLRGQLDFGLVVSGDNQDSDYNGDDRTQEFSRSVNGVDGNGVWDGALGVGPRFRFLESTVILCPLLGYAIAGQDFDIVDGYQVLATPPLNRSTGPIDGLDSRYQTRWHGPWIGMDLLLSMPFEKGPLGCLEVLFTGEYHWVDYSADANWNLRSDLQHPVSFSHDAEGSGMVVGATIGMHTRKRWGLTAGMQMREMATDPGLDRVYHADGHISETRLNEVRWRAFIVEAGLSYQF
jgi:hypothetical protein